MVRPGDSLKAATDRAKHGTRIYVLAGVYRETADPANGLRIDKSGIPSIGQNTPTKCAILENAGKPFAFAASDPLLLTTGDRGNCHAGNDYTTFFSTLGVYHPAREPLITIEAPAGARRGLFLSTGCDEIRSLPDADPRRTAAPWPRSPRTAAGSCTWALGKA